MAQKIADMNIYQKLAKLRKSVEVVQRDASGFNYTYVSDDELLSRITGEMERYGVSLIPSVTPGTLSVEQYNYVKTKKNKGEIYEEKNAEILVHGEMLFKWVNNDNPNDTVIVPWVLVGQQPDASQSFGSGLTYAYRYFLLKYFGVATPDDDPDNWKNKKNEAVAEANKAIVEPIIAEVDKIVKAYLAENKKAGAEVKEFISGFIKDGNYFAITDPETASKLLEAVVEKYTKKD